MKQNKLSLEELIKSCELIEKTLVNALPYRVREKFHQIFEQIKSLLQPIPEERLDEFVEEKAKEMALIAVRYKYGNLTHPEEFIEAIDINEVKYFIRNLLKAYDTLREEIKP